MILAVWVALTVAFVCAMWVWAWRTADRHDEHIAWLHADNTRLRAGLRSLGVDVPTDGEPAEGEGRHAASQSGPRTAPIASLSADTPVPRLLTTAERYGLSSQLNEGAA